VQPTDDPARSAVPDLSRRRFAVLAGMAVAGVVAARAARARGADPNPTIPGRDPDETLRALVDGNGRFVSGQAEGPRRRPEDWRSLAGGQSPVAAVVGCADSRVPPELVFDQGVGDLFVVRVAGNLVASPGYKVTGSLEYAVAELGVALVVVLGHTGCGAIKAAMKHIADGDAPPGAIKELVAALKPAVARAKGRPGDPVDNAIAANVELGVDRLRKLSPILAPAVRAKRLKVVGGVYDLPSGRVAMIA